MSTIDVRGACPHDCPDTCAWIATVTDGVVTKVRGDRDHPVTAGHLCIKTQKYEERVYHPDRIVTPLLRTGPIGTLAFREATWPEALSAVRAGLERVIDRRGPGAILPFSYMGTQGVLQGSSMDRRFAHALGTADLGRTICLAAGAWAWSMTYPSSWPATDIEDVPGAELVVAWGANMVSTHLHLWPFFLEARKRGATIVCVDPVRTKTARASDVHLQLRPGTDGALALGMLHVIFAEGLEDGEFLESRTVGADDLHARAAEWPLERAAAATGLAPDVIAGFARDFATAQPAFIKLGPGAQRHAASGQAFRAVLALPAVTGAWRYLGGGAHVHSAGTFADAGAAMERPELRTGPARPVNMVQLGRALAGTVDDDGPIDALVVYNSNPAVVCPDSAAVRAGLARDDLFTVVADHVATETVAYADVVLPATTQLEHLDVLWSWGHRYLTMNWPAIAPVGQARPNTEIFRLLAAELGLDHPALQEDDETLLATYLAAFDHQTRATLAAQGWAKVTPRVDPDSKVRLRNDAMAQFGLDPVPDAADADPGDDRFLVVTPKTHHFLNSSFVDHDRLRRMAGAPSALLAPVDAARLAVADGDMVRVESDHGALAVTAAVSDDVLPGTVVIPSNWWHRDFAGGLGANALTGQDLTDLGTGPQFAVRAGVRPAHASDPPMGGYPRIEPSERT
jgi:anaerobic selenocysteine-containing dehydrogenase